jgi:hypothetical protein
VTLVRYSHTISASRMRQQLLGNIWSKGLGQPGHAVQPVGVCGQDTLAVRDWMEPRPRHAVQISARNSGRPAGRLLCYDSGTGWSAIEWTDNRLDVYSVAYGDNRSPLYRWWATRGGLEPIG